MLGLERTTLQCFDLRDTTPLGAWTYRLHLLLMNHRTKDPEAAQRSLSLDAMAVLDARMLGLEGTMLQCSGLRDTTPLVDCRVCKFDLILETSQKLSLDAMAVLEARMLLGLERTTLPWCFGLRDTTPLIDWRVCKFDLVLKTSQKQERRLCNARHEG